MKAFVLKYANSRGIIAVNGEELTKRCLNGHTATCLLVHGQGFDNEIFHTEGIDWCRTIDQALSR